MKQSVLKAGRFKSRLLVPLLSSFGPTMPYQKLRLSIWFLPNPNIGQPVSEWLFRAPRFTVIGGLTFRS
jgi:hypothetical protein